MFPKGRHVGKGMTSMDAILRTDNLDGWGKEQDYGRGNRDGNNSMNYFLGHMSHGNK